ncbi:MAG: hypothetical protein J2P50_15930, partial [Hyphomicrobiaceae bacterium]|nr:hypothetical protein [Hyphomicrobiaceae bacterium]
FLFTGLALVFTGTIIENDFWETRLLHAGLCSMLLAGVALTFLLAGGILTIVQRVRDYLRKSRP